MVFTSSFLVFSMVMAFTPGPNNIMIMASGLNHGVRASLPHLAGITCGVPTMFLAIGLGMGVAFDRYPQLHIVVKILGGLYLVYLAWLIAKSATLDSDKAVVKPLNFLQTVLFQWMNPKTWILATTSIATFTAVGAGILEQIVPMALLFMLVGFLSAGTWLLFGVGLQTILKKRLYRHVFNVAMAVLLVLSVLPITLKTLNLPL